MLSSGRDIAVALRELTTAVVTCTQPTQGQVQKVTQYFSTGGGRTHEAPPLAKEPLAVTSC